MIIAKFTPIDGFLEDTTFGHTTIGFESRPSSPGKYLFYSWENFFPERAIYDDETMMEILWGEVPMDWLFDIVIDWNGYQ
jgi:hypothetical protein